jgi:hypothetical protein
VFVQLKDMVEKLIQWLWKALIGLLTECFHVTNS